ncbi:peroxisomal leader peptide-processing protease [Sphaeramia orbicularis]|uniref:Peroxisomal leader peptide-processing protease n=1 Tax=Sphaeramia orbicularis TaxID=375764 RepID=A0A673CMT0_9TELE|nr:peroxisomal leader peptide-processing protease [Sphaeramia orbicularis]
MELAEADRCCCVVTVSEDFSGKKSVSFSGVIVHPQSGTIICAGLPFSRFIVDKTSLNVNDRLITPHSLSKKLQIRVSFGPLRNLDISDCAQEPTDAEVSRSRATQHEAAAEVQMLVKCVEFRQAFQTVFHEAHQWRFHGDEEDEVMLRDAQFLSWFAVLKARSLADCGPGSGTIPWQSSSCLQKGRPVLACGTPFGSFCLDLFTSSLSRGIISNLAGEDNAVILTDARCLPGTEGGGLFLLKGADRVRLIGLIVSPFGWKANEWIGLSLVCSIHLIFKNIIRCVGTEDPLQDTVLQEREKLIHMSTAAHESQCVDFPTVCLVDSGRLWGSGVVVSPQLALTCRHVVNGTSPVTLKFHHRGRFHDVVGDVLFSTKESSPYDLALVQMRDPAVPVAVPQLAQCFNPGEPVVVVGFGGVGRSCGPSLTRGVLSKFISCHFQPVMLQTTCAVQAGTSGGAVVRPWSGELLGIVSSNTRDFAAKVTYPHLNFSIPVTVFQRVLQIFNQTKDVNVFKELDNTNGDVRRVWRLQSDQSKL